MKPYCERDGVTIYHANCLDILPMLGKVDHVITDPPYEAEAHTNQRRINRETNHRGGRVIRIESLSFDAIDPETRAAVGLEIGRLSLGWALVFCQVEATERWRTALEAGGMNYRRTCVWIKPDGMPQYSGDRPGMGYESIVAMHAKGRSRWNGGGKHGVFTVNKNDGDGRAKPHPTAKPVRLMKRLLSLFTNEGETILDPFMGSGSMGRACFEMGRKYVGIEIEEKYCEFAAKRLQQGEMSFNAL